MFTLEPWQRVQSPAVSARVSIAALFVGELLFWSMKYPPLSRAETLARGVATPFTLLTVVVYA